MLSLPLASELVTHGIGINVYEEAVTSCVLVELEAPAQSDFDDGFSLREQAAIDVLKDLAAKKNPVETGDWRRQLKGTSPFQRIDNDEMLKKALQRVRTFLVDNGVAAYDKENRLLTYIGDIGGDTKNG